jgi:hypothetical protein
MKKLVIFLAIFSFLFISENVFSQIKEKKVLQSSSTKINLQTKVETVDDELKSINNINGGMPNRISMNVTVPKQTQGATFGEKVNAGLHAAGSAISQGVLVTISGNLWWDKIEFPNTVNSVTSVGNLAGGGGGAAAASYAATGRNSNSTEEKATGISTMFFTREKGSGMATGKRQYQPIYISKMDSSCDNCVVTLKKSETVYKWDIKKNEKAKSVNPMYQENSQQGANPLYNQKMADNKDNDCDGVADINLILINSETGLEFAKTKTGKCGNFSFPNIPNGTYTLQLIGSFLTKKGYDFYMAKAVDFQGKAQKNDDSIKLVLIKNEEVATENAIIKTKTKSNQSNDKSVNNNSEIIVVKMDNSYGDVDNDGSLDMLIGGSLPGGAVISSALNARPGNPIGGLTIKGGKNPGGQMLSKITNNQGEFEFLNLDPGNYSFEIEQNVFIKSEVQIELVAKSKHDTAKNSVQNIR